MVKKREDKKEDKGRGFIDLIFSWSISDIMNNDLYRNKVNRIPDTFLSADLYLKSFIYPLIEETHADLRSNFTTICRAPASEIFNVQKDKGFELPKKLFYKLSLKTGIYEPEFGDLIALTEVRPKRIDDLDRPKRSYVVALVEGIKESSFQISIQSSKPISFEKQDEIKGKAGDKLFAVYLTNLNTNMRIWKALHPDLDGGNMKIINSVLSTNPSVADNCDLCSSNEIQSFNMSKSMVAIECIGLDDSQKLAVSKCIATSKCQHQNTVKLIWGPPGTGKTKTVSALVFSLLRMKCRTLTCAPTNVAVIGVAKRLMSLLTGTLAYETYGMGDIVLFGNRERMKIDDHDELFDIFLDHRVTALAHCFAPLTGWKGNLESMIGLLEDSEGQFERYIQLESKKNKDHGSQKGTLQRKKKVRMERHKGKHEEEKNEKELKNKESQEGTLQRKTWKELIKHELNKDKKKKSLAKTPSHARTRSKSGENDDNKNGKTEENNNEKVLLTFKEFFTERFTEFRQQLLLCMTGLYTHMPTSCLTFEVLKNMIIVRDMLQTLQSLLNRFDASNNRLRQALHGDEGICRIRLKCLEVMKILTESFSLPNLIQHFQIRNFCLSNACLMFCTASSSSKLHTEGMKPIHLVIIDEAAQLKECESTIPLQLPGISHAILVGDEKQLPAMVQSKICERAEFGRSLFERLVLLGHSKHLLNVQYRMHPSISLFPNRKFYGEKIRDGRNVLERSYKKQYLKGNMFGSYSFIDVPSGEEGFDDRHMHSQKNMVEVSVLAAIVSKLYEESIISKQKVRIGCISPYSAQISAIQDRLGKSYSSDAADKFSVNVRSVDGFQGGQEDLIIISTVRCNGNGSVGFLENCQRANVALTRARHCLWILGNGATLLNSGSVWNKLVLDAKSRGCFYSACEDESLAKAISLALFELGHVNSLFNMDSILFKKSKWKVCFSTEFQQSMKKFEKLRIHEEAISLVVKLSNGWRQVRKDKTLSNMERASSQLMECYDLKGSLKLIWTVDILRENSTEIQVIKIWDVLPLNEIPTLEKKLAVLFGNYTENFMNRCLCKQIERDLTLPMTWPVVENNKGSNASLDLANKVSTLSVRNKPESSPRRNLTFPITWPADEKFIGSNASLDSASKLSTMSLRDEPESSATWNEFVKLESSTIEGEKEGEKAFGGVCLGLGLGVALGLGLKLLSKIANWK